MRITTGRKDSTKNTHESNDQKKRLGEEHSRVERQEDKDIPTRRKSRRFCGPVAGMGAMIATRPLQSFLLTKILWFLDKYSGKLDGIREPGPILMSEPGWDEDFPDDRDSELSESRNILSLLRKSRFRRFTRNSQQRKEKP